jgi:hypothetical protein
MMKKLDKGDKMIIASLILAIGIVLSAYFIANQKSELRQCMDTFLETHPYEPDYEAEFYCASMIEG